MEKDKRVKPEFHRKSHIVNSYTSLLTEFRDYRRDHVTIYSFLALFVKRYRKNKDKRRKHLIHLNESLKAFFV